VLTILPTASWGLCVSFVGNLATAASLAEIVHVYPTSGGPYHFSALLSPPRYSNVISWITGWLACSGWVTLTATTGSLAASLLLGMYGLSHDEFESQSYQTFVIFTGFIVRPALSRYLPSRTNFRAAQVIATFINIYGSRLLPLVNTAAIIWSLTGATVILIVCLATSSPNYQSASYVFGTLINETGFPKCVLPRSHSARLPC
jgi:amino acid transporter